MPANKPQGRALSLLWGWDTVLGGLWGPPCLPRADPAPGGQRSELGPERAGFVWFLKTQIQQSAFLVHFVLLFSEEMQQTRFVHS